MDSLHSFFEFSLRKINGILENYTLPEREQEAGSGWVRRYEMFNVRPNTLMKQGSFIVSRSGGGEGPKGLQIECARRASSGFRHFIRAKLDCLDDSLSTPVRWSLSTKLARSPDDPAYLNSGLLKEAAVSGGILSVTVNGQTRKTPLPKPYTCQWCLLDAVGRLPEAKSEKLRFTLIDNFDQVAGQQTLEYGGRESVMINGKKHELRASLLTGTGTLPTVYACDDAGRLLFIISGLEAYILSSDPSTEGGGQA